MLIASYFMLYIFFNNRIILANFLVHPLPKAVSLVAALFLLRNTCVAVDIYTVPPHKDIFTKEVKLLSNIKAIVHS